MGRVPTDPAVTYRVYSADDIPVTLPRRRAAAAPSPWLPVQRAALELAVATKSWVLAPKPRPPVHQALRAPVDGVVTALRPALRSVDWRKWGLGIAIGVGTAITILLAVLTVAELADGSAKPRVAHTAVQQPVNEPAPAPVPANVPEEPAATNVVDPEPSPVMASKPAPRARVKGKKPAEVFIP